MRCLNKVRKFSMITLLAAAPSFGFAEERSVTSQSYVDAQDALKVNIAQGSGNVGKTLVVNSSGNLELSANSISGDLSGKEDVSNKLNGTSTSGQKIGDLTAGSSAGQDQVMYPSAAAVKEYAVKIAQGTGLNNANVGKSLVVNSSGNLELGTVIPQVMAGADGTDSGTAGLVPAPAATDNIKFLKGDGTWADVDAFPAGSANQVIQYNGTTDTWDAVTMDSTPTPSSLRPVTSGGVATALDNKQTKPSSGVESGKVLTYTGTDANANVSAQYVHVPIADNNPSDSGIVSGLVSVWVQQD